MLYWTVNNNSKRNNVALDGLVGRDLLAASSVLSPAQLHVVRNCRGRLDGALPELLGVTSIVHALKLRPALYNKLRDSLHSNAVQLDRLSALWTQAVLRLFPDPLRVNGRRVLVADGIKVAKCGKKMPGVKLLHQQSDSNTKPQDIMGHSMQAVSMLVRASQSVLAVPLAVRIHEGLVWSNRDRRTLPGKMISLLGIVSVKEPFYFVADAYYAARKIVKGLRDQDNLAAVFPSLVWSSFGSWLRTIRPGIPPSELVVAIALRQCLPEFLLNTAKTNSLAKFITQRQDPDTFEMFRLAT